MLLVSYVEIGIMILLISKKLVDSYWMVVVDMLKICIKVGRVVVKKVWFKMVVKELIIIMMINRMWLQVFLCILMEFEVIFIFFF